MGFELFEALPQFRERMLQLDKVASKQLGQSLVGLLYEQHRSKADNFDRTLFTHPAIFMVECALAQTLLEQGLAPNE